MFSKTPANAMNKRPREESGLQRPTKSPFGVVKVKDDPSGEMKHFKFKILMPNGTTLEFKMHERREEIPIEYFIDVIKREYFKLPKLGSAGPKRKINWEYQDLHFTDANTNKIKIKLKLLDFTCNKWHLLWLHDGSPEPDIYEGMWDLTPDTDLLKELPDDYTFETALADLIDNSLQALWSNDHKHGTRFISVELHADKLIIFDTGPGMDGKNGNLVKWGKMGASLHRAARGKAIGGSPPYLVPFFGMFGYGGPVATMCLGRRAVVSSKTKKCNKVFMLHLEREALITASHLENCWRTKGGMRDPSEDEKRNSPHGSFTKVEIFEPKMKIGDIKHFQCKLKDIYFPYIQCDEISGKTSRPVKFQVNGEDLAGIQGGEVAITYLHSCNGPDFIVQLHFSMSSDPSSVHGQSERVCQEANAQLKFVYFPIKEGKESIEEIIECLEVECSGIGESYETFSRVSIRRLGRLMPDARWALLPIMEPKKKIGEKAKSMKRCCSRVKCFIDTDAGFNPTPQKTDLAQNHPYTKALKGFGNGGNETEVLIEISKDGKKVTPLQLENMYHNWISEMHIKYDEEVDSGLDDPTVVFCSPKIKKNLGTSSDVLRVHKRVLIKGRCWQSGQRIKVLKGACAGCHSNNVYATLEYIILEGLPQDSCGGGRLICRPLGLEDDKGCKLSVDERNVTLDICESKGFPIRVIESNKCVPVDDKEWDCKLQMHNQKLPSSIELLSDVDCQELEIDGGMPADLLTAGDAPPVSIVAVIRPRAFKADDSSKRLDQKFIIKDNNIAMTVALNFRTDGNNAGEHIFSLLLSPTCCKGLRGLYCLPLKSKSEQFKLFQKAGNYTFTFSLVQFPDVRIEKILQVQTSADAGHWKVVSPEDVQDTGHWKVVSPEDVQDVLPSPLSSCLDGDSLGACEKDMGDYLVELALEMKNHRAELNRLNKVLYHLQNASDLQDHDVSSLCGKEAILENLTMKSQSAAAVIRKMHEETTLELRLQDILGVVALLGNVYNIELSRMLALYLGDHLMCSIVCENYAAAKSLEINTTIHGKSTRGGYYTLCLENFGSINCEPSSDPRELLAFPLPTRPNGDTPPGFLGFAVNLINIEATLLQWKTTGGRGLRETLFYGLFGELQVYDKRSHMIEAQSCIKGGAVSLDGGIIRPNGLLSFGQWEPDVIFPVLKNMDVTRYVKIAKTEQEIDRIKRSCNIVESKFDEVRVNYNSQQVRV